MNKITFPTIFLVVPHYTHHRIGEIKNWLSQVLPLILPLETYQSEMKSSQKKKILTLLTDILTPQINIDSCHLSRNGSERQEECQNDLTAMSLLVSIFPTNAPQGLLVSVMQDEHNGPIMAPEAQWLSNLCWLGNFFPVVTVCAACLTHHIPTGN